MLFGTPQGSARLTRSREKERTHALETCARDTIWIISLYVLGYLGSERTWLYLRDREEKGIKRPFLCASDRTRALRGLSIRVWDAAVRYFAY